MSTLKLLLYAITGIITLVVLTIVVQAVLAALAFIWFLAWTLTLLAVLGGVGFVGYKLYSLVSGLRSSETETTGDSEFSMDDFGSRDTTNTSDMSTGNTDPADNSAGNTRTASSAENIRQQYMNGEISEAEFERRLERELDSNEFDSIDRELQRERT